MILKIQGTNPQCFLELVKGLYLHKKFMGSTNIPFMYTIDSFQQRVDHSIILESVFAFLIIRLFYIIFYLVDWGISRAITWALGIFVCLWLILKSYMNIN